jgi:hypothetical protein
MGSKVLDDPMSYLNPTRYLQNAMPSECGTASGSANVTPLNGKAERYLGLERQPLQNRRP